MERMLEVGEKDCEELLVELRNKYGEGNPLYIRRSKFIVSQFLKIFDKEIKTLEEGGFVRIESYLPPWITDSEGHRVENTQQKIDPDVMALHLLPKAEEVLKSRTTITRTETTVQETFEPVESINEPAWKANKRLRDFVRTERGNAITTMCPAALESTIRGHVQAIRSGTIPRKDMKSRQMWLMYILAWRWDEIPEQLRREAEDCRDLQTTRRRRKDD